MKIFKYVLAKQTATMPMVQGEHVVKMPAMAHILSAGIQSDYSLVVWASVDDAERTVNHRILVVPTGGDEPARGRFIGTVQSYGLVWHLFDGGEK